MKPDVNGALAPVPGFLSEQIQLLLTQVRTGQFFTPRVR
jgi:hypothetical protein